MKKILGLMFGLATLGGCERILGPIDTVLTVEKDMSLLTNKNRRWEPKAGESSEVQFFYDVKKKTFYVKPNRSSDEAVGFFNSVVSNDQKRISSSPANSGRVSFGEKVGMEAERSILCTNGVCETVDVRRSTERCTYYVRQPISHCRPLPNGGSHCWTEWRDYPMSGYQWVEHRDVTRTYAYTLRIFGEKTGDLAKASMERSETQRTSRAVTACR